MTEDLDSDHGTSSKKSWFKDADLGVSDRDAEGNLIPKWKIWYARGMLGWSVVSNVFLFVQAGQIFQDKDATGVSLPAYIMYCFGTLVWIFYGAVVLTKRNLVIIVSSTIGLIGGITILVGVILYGMSQKVEETS